MDFEEVNATLDKAAPDVLIHGKARGADTLAEEWGYDRDVQVHAHPALWTVHGRAAGPKRNREMLLHLLSMQETHRIGVIAFPGGTGTANMISIAEAAGVKVWKRGAS